MSSHASAPFDEQVAAALLPVLLHRINNTTQGLTVVRALLDGGDLPALGVEQLASASSSAHEEGWLLGVIAGGLGADLLLARHERDGLKPVLVLVRDGLRRDGRELAYDVERVPALAAPRDSRSPESWRVSWAVASLVWHAAARLPGAARLTIRFDHAGATCVLHGDRGASDDWLAAARAICASLAAGAECTTDGEAWSFTLPRASTFAGG